MRISDWSSDVCSSDLHCGPRPAPQGGGGRMAKLRWMYPCACIRLACINIHGNPLSDSNVRFHPLAFCRLAVAPLAGVILVCFLLAYFGWELILAGSWTLLVAALLVGGITVLPIV